MPLPKRFNFENQIYYITSKTFNNQPIFNNLKTCQLFIDVLKIKREELRFKLLGIVIIFDHIHLLIWVMSCSKYTISQITHDIKGRFAYEYLQQNHKGSAKRTSMSTRVGEPLWFTGSRQRVRVNPVWQKTFYEHVIRSKKDFQEKLDYIHKNPLKYNIVSNLEDWSYSSFHNYFCNHTCLIDVDFVEW